MASEQPAACFDCYEPRKQVWPQEHVEPQKQVGLEEYVSVLFHQDVLSEQ
jgi:hypothetical protein